MKSTGNVEMGQPMGLLIVGRMWRDEVVFTDRSLVAGWWLITPPFVGGYIDKEAPLSLWDEEAHFPSLGDCSDERDRQLQGVTEELDEIDAEYRVSPSRYFRDPEQLIDIEEIANGLTCISSEDSRLERT